MYFSQYCPLDCISCSGRISDECFSFVRMVHTPRRGTALDSFCTLGNAGSPVLQQQQQQQQQKEKEKYLTCNVWFFYSLLLSDQFFSNQFQVDDLKIWKSLIWWTQFLCYKETWLWILRSSNVPSPR